LPIYASATPQFVCAADYVGSCHRLGADRGGVCPGAYGMARFPTKEPDIVVLAQRMVDGLTAHLDVYPDPPVRPGPLRMRTLSYLVRRDRATAAEAAARQAVATKDEALGQLVEAVKADLRYAENTVDFDDAKLKLIGWSGRRERAPVEPPGQPRLLEAASQHRGRLSLDWKAPADGGRPNAYTVQRRQPGDDADTWHDVATAIDTEAILADQPEAIGVEYRVMAVNRSGAGPASNTVSVTL